MQETGKEIGIIKWDTHEHEECLDLGATQMA